MICCIICTMTSYDTGSTLNIYHRDYVYGTSYKNGSGVNQDIKISMYIPGGTIIITTRYKHLHTVVAYKDKMEPYLKELQAEGLWKQEERIVFPKYYMEDDGIVWRYTVLWWKTLIRVLFYILIYFCMEIYCSVIKFLNIRFVLYFNLFYHFPDDV